MPWPLDAASCALSPRGLETVLVVEDKLPFLEASSRRRSFGVPRAPWVLGKKDTEGRELLPVSGGVSADDVARALARFLPGEGAPEALIERVRRRVEDRSHPLDRLAIELKRTPYFCSGCPHNTSTRVGAEQLSGSGSAATRWSRLRPTSAAAMCSGWRRWAARARSGSGSRRSPSEQHFTQNLGDGTFHHSGSLAIRAAIARASTSPTGCSTTVPSR